MNGKTSAREQEKLRQEMLNSQHPLVLTDLLREVMNLPSPPPELREQLERLDRASSHSCAFRSRAGLDNLKEKILNKFF